MNPKITVLISGLLGFSVTGCAYMEDRARDASDIINVSAVTGVGVAAQVSAIDVTFGSLTNATGLEDGSFYCVPGFDLFPERTQAGQRQGCGLVNTYASLRNETVEHRNKNSSRMNFLGIFTAWGICGPSGKSQPNYWTKFEVNAALGVGAKVGVNPGEALDFLLGWFCLDIYGDDIAAVTTLPHEAAHKSASKKPAQDMVPALAKAPANSP